MEFTSPSGKIPSITLVLNLVIVSSLRCGAQRCIPFTPYFTFDHWIPKYRQTRPQSSDAMHRRIFNFPGSSVAAGLPPSPESRAGSFWSEQVGKYYLLGQKPPARGVIRVARNLAEVRRWVVRRDNAQSKSCTYVALCLVPRFLHPYRSCGWAENEREYGGDDEECPSGNDGVDRAECWYRPSCDEVPDHTC